MVTEEILKNALLLVRRPTAGLQYQVPWGILYWFEHARLATSIL